MSAKKKDNTSLTEAIADGGSTPKQQKSKGKKSPGGSAASSNRSASPSKIRKRVAKPSAWSIQKYLSKNPDKAWAELFFLKYSLVWPVLFGSWAKSGLHLKTGDAGNLLVSVLIAAPNFVYPYLFCPTSLPQKQGEDGAQRDAIRPIHDTFWFKYLIWLFIFAFVATYFWTEYFFDVLGMKYAFKHLNWNFDSALVGSGEQRVPLMMLFHGFYFFITYHTCSVVFIRVVESNVERFIPNKQIRSGGATILAALFFAWAEIKFTTMDSIKDQFEYGDMDWALSWGAGIYACYFIASFPFVMHLDESKTNRWTLSQTIVNSLAASMLGFIYLDMFILFIVPPTWRAKKWFVK